MNLEKYEGYEVKKTGLYLVDAEANGESYPCHIYNYPDNDDGSWRGLDPVEISWVVAGFYFQNLGSPEKTKIQEVICSCPDIEKADMIQVLLKERRVFIKAIGKGLNKIQE